MLPLQMHSEKNIHSVLEFSSTITFQKQMPMLLNHQPGRILDVLTIKEAWASQTKRAHPSDETDGIHLMGIYP